MKKLLPLVLICLMLVYACKKSDNSPATDNATLIVGKWALTKTILVKSVNGVESNVEVEDSIPPNGYLQFNKNGTVTGIGSNSGNYTLSNNVLTLSADSSSLVFKVRTLDAHNLVIRLENLYTEDGATYSNDDYFTKQ